MKKRIMSLILAILIFGMLPCAYAMSDAETNAALGKVPTLNEGVSALGGYPVEYLTDGDLTKAAAILGEGGSGTDFTYTIDLEEEQSVYAIELLGRASDESGHELSNLTIKGGKTLDALEEIAKTPGWWEESAIKNGEPRRFTLPEEKIYRYITISGNVPGGYVFVCCEMKVLVNASDSEDEEIQKGPINTSTDTNIALNKGFINTENLTYFNNNDAVNFGVQKLTDGNESSFCALQGAEGQAFSIMLDLEDVYAVSAIELVARGGADYAPTELSNITIKAGETLEFLEAVAITPGHWTEDYIQAGATWRFDLPELKGYRYVELSGSLLGQFYLTLCTELRVFGGVIESTPDEGEDDDKEDSINTSTDTNIALNKGFINTDNLKYLGDDAVNFGVHKLTDGDESGFCSLQGSNGQEYSFVLDLEDVYTVSALELVARTTEAGYTNYDLSNITIKAGETLDSLETLTTTPGFWMDNVIQAGTTWRFDLPELKGYRYFEFSGTHVGEAFIILCKELKVFGGVIETTPDEGGDDEGGEDVTPSVNVALGKTVKTSGNVEYLGGCEADKMLDNEMSTITALVVKEGEESHGIYEMQVDLGGYYNITEIKLKARESGFGVNELSGITVSGSTVDKAAADMDTIGSTPAWNAEDALGQGDVWTHKFEKPLRYRYITLNGSLPSGYVIVCAELEIYGTPVESLETTEVNVLLNKPFEVSEGVAALSDNHAFSHMNDGIESTPAAVHAAVSSINFTMKYDLLNFYDINALEIVARTKDEGWSNFDLGSIKIYGSIADVPASQMEEITMTPYNGSDEAIGEGETWRFDLPEAKKYRYIFLEIPVSHGMVFFCKELRALSYTSTDFGEWNITDKNGKADKIVVGETYTVNVPLTNYSAIETNYYIMILGTYDSNGLMTDISCNKIMVPEVGKTGTLTATITIPSDTVRMNAVLINNLSDSLMVLDSVDLYTE